MTTIVEDRFAEESPTGRPLYNYSFAFYKMTVTVLSRSMRSHAHTV